MRQNYEDRITHTTCMIRAANARLIAAQYPPGSEWRVLYVENAIEWLRLARYYR